MLHHFGCDQELYILTYSLLSALSFNESSKELGTIFHKSTQTINNLHPNN